MRYRFPSRSRVTFPEARRRGDRPLVGLIGGGQLFRRICPGRVEQTVERTWFVEGSDDQRLRGQVRDMIDDDGGLKSIESGDGRRPGQPKGPAKTARRRSTACSSGSRTS